MAAPKRPLTGDALLVAVTDAMVALHEQYHHRPPATAKTRLMGDDLLACVLGGVYTDVEKTLIELERAPVVRENRGAFSNAMQHRFIAEVQRLSGRRVVDFISSHHVGPDLEVELFFLADHPSVEPVSDRFLSWSSPHPGGVSAYAMMPDSPVTGQQTDPTITAALDDGPLEGRNLETRLVEGRPPKTIDVPADDGSTCRYCLAEWVQTGQSAVYTFLYRV